MLYYIQEFIFSLSWVFHVATASLCAIRSHVRASVDRNMLHWLVDLHSVDFVAMRRREWLMCGRDWGAKRRENKHSNTLGCSPPFCKIEGIGTQAKFQFRIEYMYMCNIATFVNTGVPENEKLLSSKKYHHLRHFINATIQNSYTWILVSFIKCISFHCAKCQWKIA